MNERDIDSRVVVVKALIEETMKAEGANADQRCMAVAAIELLGNLMVDVNRIASALEEIAKKG